MSTQKSNASEYQYQYLDNPYTVVFPEIMGRKWYLAQVFDLSHG